MIQRWPLKKLFYYADWRNAHCTNSTDGRGSSWKYESCIAASDVIRFVGSIVNIFCNCSHTYRIVSHQWYLRYPKSFLLLCIFNITLSLQCSDTVGWVTGRASGLLKACCWFVGGDSLTAALHVLKLQLSTPPPSSLAPIKSRLEKFW